MKRGGDEDSGREAVWDYLHAGLTSQRRDLAGHSEPPAAGQVGLEDVDVAVLDERPEGRDGRVGLAGGDADVDRVREALVAAEVIWRQRFL